MKAKDFKQVMIELEEYINDKTLNYYLYNNLYTFSDNKEKLAYAINIKISYDSMQLDYYKLLDLLPNKHGGKSYQDSKTFKREYYNLTHKQINTVNTFFESIYHKQEGY